MGGKQGKPCKVFFEICARFGCCTSSDAIPLQMGFIYSSVKKRNSPAILVLTVAIAKYTVPDIPEISLRTLTLSFAAHVLLENHGNL